MLLDPWCRRVLAIGAAPAIAFGAAVAAITDHQFAQTPPSLAPNATVTMQTGTPVPTSTSAPTKAYRASQPVSRPVVVPTPVAVAPTVVTSTPTAAPRTIYVTITASPAPSSTMASPTQTTTPPPARGGGVGRGGQ